jgi:hypothetical protein
MNGRLPGGRDLVTCRCLQILARGDDGWSGGRVGTQHIIEEDDLEGIVKRRTATWPKPIGPMRL